MQVSQHCLYTEVLYVLVHVQCSKLNAWCYVYVWHCFSFKLISFAILSHLSFASTLLLPPESFSFLPSLTYALYQKLCYIIFHVYNLHIIVYNSYNIIYLYFCNNMENMRRFSYLTIWLFCIWLIIQVHFNGTDF